jgi:hypothetical protein
MILNAFLDPMNPFLPVAQLSLDQMRVKEHANLKFKHQTFH